MKNGKVYTKEYNDADRCIFKYKALSDSGSMIKVHYFAVLLDEIGCEEPERGMDTEIFIGTGTERSDYRVREATDFEIKYLLSFYANTITGISIKKIEVEDEEELKIPIKRVVKAKTKIIPYAIEHCRHCPLRSDKRCYMNTVKDVEQNYDDKTLHKECPLRDDYVIEVKLKKKQDDSTTG